MRVIIGLFFALVFLPTALSVTPTAWAQTTTQPSTPEPTPFSIRLQAIVEMNQTDSHQARNLANGLWQLAKSHADKVTAQDLKKLGGLLEDTRDPPFWNTLTQTVRVLAQAPNGPKPFPAKMLLPGLRDEETFIAAVGALGAIKARLLLPLAHQYLTDDRLQTDHRAALINQLVHYPPMKGMVPVLADRLNEKPNEDDKRHLYFRNSIAVLLGRWNVLPKFTIPALKKALSDPAAIVRRSAFEALGKTVSPEEFWKISLAVLAKETDAGVFKMLLDLMVPILFVSHRQEMLQIFRDIYSDRWIKRFPKLTRIEWLRRLAGYSLVNYAVQLDNTKKSPEIVKEVFEMLVDMGVGKEKNTPLGRQAWLFVLRYTQFYRYSDKAAQRIATEIQEIRKNSARISSTEAKAILALKKFISPRFVQMAEKTLKPQVFQAKPKIIPPIKKQLPQKKPKKRLGLKRKPHQH